MRRHIAFLFVLVCPLSAYALPSVSLTGAMNSTATRGDTKVFDLTLTVTPSFQGTLALYVHSQAGLTVRSVEAAPMTCTKTADTFTTCAGSNLSGTINIKVTIFVEPALAVSSPTWSAEVGGDFLSGGTLKFGTITVEQRPHIELRKYPRAIVLDNDESLAGVHGSTSFVVANEGDASGLVTPSLNENPFYLIGENHRTISISPTVGILYQVDFYGGKSGVYKDVVKVDSAPDSPLFVDVRAVVGESPSRKANPVPFSEVVFDLLNAIFGKTASPLATSTATLTITNTGEGAVSGAFSSDSPWMIPPDGLITIAPNETKSFAITVDPSLLPADVVTGGAVTATLDLAYLNPKLSAKSRLAPMDTTTPSKTSSISVSVVAVVKPTSGTATIPPLAHRCQADNNCWDETAILLPGVTRTPGPQNHFISDLKVFPKVGFGGTGQDLKAIAELDVYYTPLKSTAAKKVSIPSVSPPSVAIYGDMLGSVFGATQETGTLMIRAPGFQPDESIAASAVIRNITNSAGSYGASVPAFNSYYASKAANDNTYLAGLRSGSGGHTDIILQESLGKDATASVDFYDASGKKVGSTSAALSAFTAQQVETAAVPSGTVSAVVSLGSGSGGVHAYANVVDEVSGDSYVVADWRRVYEYNISGGSSSSLLVPVVGSIHGRNNSVFTSDLTVMNIGTASGTSTVRYYNQRGGVVEKSVTVASLETKVFSNVTSSLFGLTGDNIGFIVLTPPTGTKFVVTSRAYTTAASGAVYSTNVPVTYQSGITGFGSKRPTRIAGVDDAAFARIDAQQPGSYRSNFGLIESAGKPATVKVTVSYRAVTDKVSSMQTASATYQLMPYQMLMGSIANVIAGRQDLGDLHDMSVDFQVTAGAGTVLPFISTIDNASGDSIVRLP